MKESIQERRKYQRFPLPFAHYESKDKKGIRGVSDVWDVSREGFRIISEISIKRGSVLQFYINVPGVLDIQCEGQVCWSKAIKEGYAIGLRFTAMDPGQKSEFLGYAYKVWVKEEKAKRPV